MLAVAMAVVGLSTSSSCGSFTLKMEEASWRAVLHYEDTRVVSAVWESEHVGPMRA